MTEQKPAWLDKALEAKERMENKSSLAEPPTPDMFAEAVPDADIEEPKVLPQYVEDSDKALDKLIDRITILDAYRMWCGKMTPEVKPGQVESIMISCPVPGHADNNPSAWINLTKGDGGLWHCMACGQGGDKWDLAAFHFGITDYKSGQNFHNLRREIGKQFGWAFEKDANGFIVGVSPEEQAKKAEAAKENVERTLALQSAKQEGNAAVIDISTGEEVDEEEEDLGNLQMPTLQWQNVVRPDSFLDVYMRSTTVDSAPEEFHFWNALQALGLAVGRDVYMEEDHKFYSNIYTCVIGTTASGKSKAKRSLTATLGRALPWDPTHATKDGVYLIPRAGSGEFLVEVFKGEHRPVKGSAPLSKGDVKGFVNFEELSDIIGRSARQGSTMKETIQELYDGGESISNASKSGGTDIAERPFCALSVGVQPDMLRKLLSSDDAASGFLNRFIFVTGTHKRQDGINKTVVDMSTAATMLSDINAWGRKGVQIVWSESAEAAFLDFYDEKLEKYSRPEAPAVMKRMAFLIKKLIMLFAINDMSEVVDIEHVDYAVDLYDYIIQSYMKVDSSVSLSEQSELENKILTHIKEIQTKKGQAWWVGEKTLMTTIKFKKYERREMLNAFEMLIRTGELVKAENPSNSGRGRPIVGRGYMPA